MLGVLHTLVVMLTLTLTSCSNDDDYRAPGTIPETDYDFSFTLDGTTGYVYTIQEHTKGTNGFPVVIMADGYTQKEITSGEYDKIVNNAVNAMKSLKPMTDLIDYLDIYKVVVTSEESGIDYKKHDTAFKTYLESKNSTNVWGDSVKIKNFTYNALRQNESRLDNALSIVLLNSSDYAGVTLMQLDTHVEDSIPLGWSLSYVPAYATVSNGDNVFNELIQHEAVGHGIGKLADEYYYNDIPTDEEIADFRHCQKYGWSLNIKYFDDEETGAIDSKYLYRADKTLKYYVQKSENPSDDRLSPFANDSRYADENCKWIQGGFTFITLTNTYCGEDMEFIEEDGSKHMESPNLCKSHFYRSSGISIMGDVVTYVDLKFNILSRMALYRRINRVANGAGWKFDYSAFMNFDKPSSSTSNTKRLYAKKPTPYYNYNKRNVEESNKKKAKPVILR